jgi:hypothetical protein
MKLNNYFTYLLIHSQIVSLRQVIKVKNYDKINLTVLNRSIEVNKAKFYECTVKLHSKKGYLIVETRFGVGVLINLLKRNSDFHVTEHKNNVYKTRKFCKELCE